MSGANGNGVCAPGAPLEAGFASPYVGEPEHLLEDYVRLMARAQGMEERLRRGDEHRRAMVHIMADLNTANKKLASQRKAMLHILADYEQDRSRLGQQSERLRNSRRALLHILTDAHQSNLKLENGRTAMIHIMDDLRKTTEEIKRREKELRDKQEQLVQAAKLATLGELTTGVAHELNNPLNNIGLFIGNVLDAVELGAATPQVIAAELGKAMQQVGKATKIITHLRTFGRAAPVSHEIVAVAEVVERALSLMVQQLRGRHIEVVIEPSVGEPRVLGNPIQLEQVFINLLGNARDAVKDSAHKQIRIGWELRGRSVRISVRDTGQGIPEGLEQRIFDPFFTTKEVGQGTGLGLSITYGIIKDHKGTIAVVRHPPGEGAEFRIELPLASESAAPPATATAVGAGGEG